jgi:hypothetical protein
MPEDTRRVTIKRNSQVIWDGHVKRPAVKHMIRITGRKAVSWTEEK